MTQFTVHRALLVLGLLAMLVACSQQPDASDFEVPYLHMAQVAPAMEMEQFQINREFAGLVVARQTTSLGFELSGKVSEIYVDEGDSIESGQILAQLDTELLDIRRRELDAQVLDVKAQAALNALDLQRVESLREKGFTSDSEADRLSTQKETLAARLEQLKAEIQANETRLEKSRLEAPYTGVVSRRLIDAGTVVNAGDALVTLLEGQGFEARVGVPVSALADIQPGDNLEVVVERKSHDGTVLAVGSDVTRGSLTVPVRVALPDDTSFVAGDQAYLQLTENVDQSGYWLPTEALTDGIRGLWNIYVAVPDPESGQHRLEARDIEVIHAGSQSSFIRGALAHNELIVQGGLHRLTPGQRVRASQDLLAQN